MAIITTTDLNNFYAELDYSTKRMFSERTISLNEAKSRGRKAVFLSHSHQDKAFIEKAAAILRKIGVDVYVDWLDKTMPESPNGETASRIKGKIKDSNKFVLLVSNNSIKSNWVNWELGFGDAHKYINNIAMFPFSEATQSFSGAEYLSIYPHVEKERDYKLVGYEYKFVDEYVVKYSDGKKIDLKTWLNS